MCILIYLYYTVFLNMSTSEVCLAYVKFRTFNFFRLRLINCKVCGLGVKEYHHEILIQSGRVPAETVAHDVEHSCNQYCA